jgi:aspartate oxidase
MGVYVLDKKTGDVKTYFSHYVILATGGVGNLYQHTTTLLPQQRRNEYGIQRGADIINADLYNSILHALFIKILKDF